MPTNTPSEAEIARMHRYFAVECNNAAWDLAERTDRDAGATDQMLRCAAASAWHWSEVGQPINLARADALLAWAYALAGQPETARRHADRAAARIDQPAEGVTDWDRSFQAVVEARVRHAESDPGKYREALSALDDARQRLADTEDRAVFDRFRAGLHPGGQAGRV